MPSILDRPSAVPWPPLLLIGSIGLGIAVGRLVPAPFGGPATRYIGVLLTVMALALDATAVLTLFRHKTTVLPHRGSDALVTAGPFAFSRNPIYLGNVVLTAGLALAFANSWLMAAAVVEAVLLQRLAIIPEERHLEARFGDAWHSYRLRTSRWFGASSG